MPVLADQARIESPQTPSHVGAPSHRARANLVQRSVAPGSTARSLRGNAPPVVKQALSRPGQPLRAHLATEFAPLLGHQFASVRVHDDEAAARSADAVGARAYTVGDHVVFGRGQFAPNTAAGRSVLAHELVHVAQQAGGSRLDQLAVGEDHQAAEREADALAAAFLGGRHVRPAVHATPRQVSRQSWWQRTKNRAYDGLIAGLRAAKRAHIAALRTADQP